MSAADPHLDGNAAGGELGAVFAFETTGAQLSCAGCGTVRPIGAHLLYATAMGTVLRCVDCESALLTIVHVRGALRLQMQGVAWISVAEAPAPEES